MRTISAPSAAIACSRSAVWRVTVIAATAAVKIVSSSPHRRIDPSRADHIVATSNGNGVRFEPSSATYFTDVSLVRSAICITPTAATAATSATVDTQWVPSDAGSIATRATASGNHDATSAVVNAAKLTRPLLLVHGLTDDNVYVANTLALADALFAAGKPYELLTLPGTHMMADPKADAALLTREIDFFRQHLGLPAAR